MHAAASSAWHRGVRQRRGGLGLLVWACSGGERAVQVERLGPEQLVLLHHCGLQRGELLRRALVQPAVLHGLRAHNAHHQKALATRS
jgi:hypothetical protein